MPAGCIFTALPGKFCKSLIEVWISAKQHGNLRPSFMHYKNSGRDDSLRKLFRVSSKARLLFCSTVDFEHSSCSGRLVGKSFLFDSVKIAKRDCTFTLPPVDRVNKRAKSSRGPHLVHNENMDESSKPLGFILNFSNSFWPTPTSINIVRVYV